VVIAGLENNRLPNVQEIRRKSVHYPNYQAGRGNMLYGYMPIVRL